MKGGSAQRTVASWELVATLFCIYLWAPTDSGSEGSCACTGATDNQGNSSIVNKMLTSKFPLSVVLMQLSTLLEQRGCWLGLNWICRDSNTEADALTNEEFGGFSLANRVEVKWLPDSFDVMRTLLPAGAALFTECKRAREEEPHSVREPKRTVRLRRDQRLRVTHPW